MSCWYHKPTDIIFNEDTHPCNVIAWFFNPLDCKVLPKEEISPFHQCPTRADKAGTRKFAFNHANQPFRVSVFNHKPTQGTGTPSGHIANEAFNCIFLVISNAVPIHHQYWFTSKTFDTVWEICWARDSLVIYQKYAFSSSVKLRELNWLWKLSTFWLIKRSYCFFSSGFIFQSQSLFWDKEFKLLVSLSIWTHHLSIRDCISVFAGKFFKVSCIYTIIAGCSLARPTISPLLI